MKLRAGFRRAICVPLFAAVFAVLHAETTGPVPDMTISETLNGTWSFRYIAGHDAGPDEGFSNPDFDITGWKPIDVPSNWELKGFAEPRYALELEDGLGLYRRGFQVPSDWLGPDRRVFLRFDGVAYGFKAWVNGHEVGESSASSYNPHTFDVTGALKDDGDNVLAVKVATRPLGYEFDVNDDWSLSGIFRDVTLFSVPATHLRDITTATTLTEDGAELTVTVDATGGEVRGTLIAPDGNAAGELVLQNRSHESYTTYSGKLAIPHPHLWTAETPALYQLRLTLSQHGKPLQKSETRIGLREVSIKDSVLLLNGRPIKLRGVNHHDISPVNGRAITDDEMRQDLELMRQANINFVRTSHYQPNQRFIDLCDEMGFYVMDEVSIGKGEEHLNNPRYRDNILARVEPTITRDKNHASVLIWSIGNENPVTDVELEAARLAKKLDPTRPICIPKIGSYFEQNYQKIPDFVDIHAPHYPGNTTLKRFARKLKRPLILTEYAHALGLGTERMHDQWEILQATPTFAGGAIWHFHDQGILRKVSKSVNPGRQTSDVWLDPHTILDAHGNFGADGIVYADRTPQTDFWEVRKVYAPVRIEESRANVKPGEQTVSLTVANRFDFRPLEGMKLAWSLRRNGTELQHDEVALTALPHHKETVAIPVNIPADAGQGVLILDIRCVDGNRTQVTERSVRLDLPDADLPGAITAADNSPIHVTEQNNEVKVETPRWVLTLKRENAELTIHDRSGHRLVAGIRPHPGRRFTMTERIARGKTNMWNASTLTDVRNPDIKVSNQDGTVRLAVSGTYPRNKPTGDNAREEKLSSEPLDQQSRTAKVEISKDEALVGGYEAEITPSGEIRIRYAFTPAHTNASFAEAGLSVVVPEDLSEFRWIGQGPYAGYPGKEQLNEFGAFHLNREDLRFQGNRRATEVAILTTADGAGVALVTQPADVSVERSGNKTFLSHNAVISSLGNKGASPETLVKASNTPHITGSFTLVPLDNKWPAPLTRWFGEPAAATDVFKPFFHSYDQ